MNAVTSTSAGRVIRSVGLLNGVGDAVLAATFQYTFRYSKAARTWMLDRIDIDNYSRDDPPPHTHERLTAAKLGQVKFEEFDATPYGIAQP